MSEWQDIRTAPKDGSFIIAAKESVFPAFEVTRFPYPLKQRWNGKKWEADDGHVYAPQPTHWQPLPEPPK
jgi:hypothetical protein